MPKDIVLDTSSWYCMLVLLFYDKFIGSKYLLQHKYHIEKHVFDNEVKYFKENSEKFCEFCENMLLTLEPEVHNYFEDFIKICIKYIGKDHDLFFYKIFEELLKNNKLQCSELDKKELLKKYNFIELKKIIEKLDLKNFKFNGKTKNLGELVSFLYALCYECDGVITLDKGALGKIVGFFKKVNDNYSFYYPFNVAIYSPSLYLQEIIDNKDDLLIYLHILKEYINYVSNDTHPEYIYILTLVDYVLKTKE